MVYLLGAGGHALVILDALRLNQISVEGFIDDYSRQSEIKSLTVYTKPPNNISKADLIIAIGNNSVRKKISEKYSDSKYIQAIHPAAIVAEDVQVGLGTVLMAGVVVNTGAVIGKHVILNTGALIDHDCHIEDFVHISPKVALAGNVMIGEGTHIGIGASIIQGVSIGKWATIGAGAVIIKDVPDYATVVGVPGRIIKFNKNDEE
jgi:acetyltransferase EpsM